MLGEIESKAAAAVSQHEFKTAERTFTFELAFGMRFEAAADKQSS